MKNTPKLLSVLQKAQAQMANAQKKMNESRFEGSAGGGLVKVQIKGTGELVELTIDPSVMSEDHETAAELVQAAYGAAYAQKEQAAKQVLREVAGGLAPAGFAVPGLG